MTREKRIQKDGWGMLSTPMQKKRATFLVALTILDLGLVEGVSEVFVNGQSAGVQYFGRRIYDISDYLQEGKNDLQVRVTTTMGNYLKTISREENPTTWIYVNHPKRDQPLQPMGLLGPVRLYHNPAP